MVFSIYLSPSFGMLREVDLRTAVPRRVRDREVKSSLISDGCPTGMISALLVKIYLIDSKRQGTFYWYN